MYRLRLLFQLCLGLLATAAWGVNQAPSFSLPAGVVGSVWANHTGSPSTHWGKVASSADGSKLVAAQFSGSLYTSTDFGVTWTARVNYPSGTWGALASSADGLKLVAGGSGGSLYVSTNGGVSWTQKLTDTGRFWNSISMSADGTRVLAAAQEGVFVSTDSGVTWTQVMVGVGGTCTASSADGLKLMIVSQGALVLSNDGGSTWGLQPNIDSTAPARWTVAASSADGTRLVAASFLGKIYTSADSGATWTAHLTDTDRSWLSITSSADGMRLAAVQSGDYNSIPNTNGNVYLSADGGATWSLHPNAEALNWSAVAYSADGSHLTAGVDGGNVQSSAALYTLTVPNGPAPYTQPNFATSSPGPASEAAQVVNFTVNTTSSQLFDTLPAIDSSGTLTFKTSPGASGSSTEIVTVHDNGGTANGGVDTAPAQVFLINVPVYSTPTNITLSATSVLENSPANTTVGTLTATNANSADTHVFTLVAGTGSTDNASFTITGSTLKLNLGVPVESQASYAIRMRATDVGGAFFEKAFVITVIDVNQAPSFTLNWGPSIITSNNYGPFSAQNFVYPVSPGPAGEAAQTVTFTVTNNAPSLFSVQPSIDSSNTLTFLSVPQALGTATLTVTAKDNGGTANGGEDTSPAQTFTLTFQPDHLPTDITMSANTVMQHNAANTVVGTFTITDEATSTPVFALVAGSGGVDNASFTITGNVLKVVPVTDAATKSTYSIRVRATNSVGGTLDKIFSIYVVNPAQVNQPPSFSLRYGVPEAWNQTGPVAQWRSIACSADRTKLVAVATGGFIYTSTDGGVTWISRAASRAWRAVASSADGTRLAAVVYGGLIYTSGDSGVTWVQQVSGTHNWQCIACSTDGSRLVAGDYGGRLYTSPDSGVTWTPQGPAGLNWQSLASSADGTRLVAAVLGGQIYTSADSGATRAALSVSGSWQSVCSSADGRRLAAVNASNASIYTSADYGASWQQGLSLDLPSGLAITCSADGGTLLACNSYEGVYLSQDFGVTWVSRPLDGYPVQCLAISADGTLMAAGVAGGPLFYSNTVQPYLISTWAGNVPSTIASVVTQISPGPVAEASQQVNLILTADEPSLFSVQPAIDSSGTLTFATSATTPGTATITVVAQDDGGTALGGVDTSPPRTFLIDILPVNYPPTDITLSASSIAENNVPNASVGIFSTVDANAGDTATYTLVPGAGSTDNASFAIVAGRTLSIIPQTNYNTQSSYSLRVRVTDSAAAYLEKVFVITILYQNKVPSFALPTGGPPGPAGDMWTARLSDASRNWSALASSADGMKLVAAVNAGYVYTSTDFGATWTARMTDATRHWRALACSADGTKLVAIVNAGQLYTSTDSGATWTARIAAAHQWTALTSSPDGTMLVAAESQGLIYFSTDSGVTWTARAFTRDWVAITSSANGTKIVAAAGGSGVGAIYTSADAGLTWVARSALPLYLNWTSLACSADGSKIAGAATGAAIYTSSDFGATWTARASALGWSCIASSADGSRLAAVVKGGIIYTSSNGGVTWAAKMTDGGRAWTSIACSADGTRLVAGVSFGYLYTSLGASSLLVPGGTGPFTQSGFATSISPGPVGEEAQTVSFILASDSPALFTAPPALDGSGTLTFTLAPNVSGATAVTVQAHDNGGTANGGVDTSAAQVFYIQIPGPNPIVGAWRASHFGTTTHNIGSNEDFDGDGVPNLVEMAFGADPANAGSGRGPLQFNGTLANGGTIGRTGQPCSMFEGTDSRVLFVRRKDYLAAGLIYDPQFSADMAAWQTSTFVPTVLADDGTNQIVSVPYPQTDAGHQGWFFRVVVTVAP